MFILHLAEALLSLPFFLGGVSTLLRPEPRAAQIARLRFPLASTAVRVNALIMIAMIAAGAFLALGLWAQIAAWVLIAVLIPTTLFGHAFWLEPGVKRLEQLSHFVKNLSLIGGLLLVTLIAR
jgi:putative oxidoreductase